MPISSINSGTLAARWQTAPAEASRGDPWRSLPAAVQGRREPFLWLLGVLLAVYAVLGRSGAHIGVNLGVGTGIYIGDLVLVSGIAYAIIDGSWARFFRLPLAWLWLMFVAWNATQTFPYISRYGLLALRDATLWGYSLFAVIVASLLMARPAAFAILLDRFGRFARLYVYAALVIAPLAIAYFTEGISVPGLVDFPPPATNLMLPVAGATAFVLCRLATVPLFWWWATAMAVMLIGSQGRGAFISLLAAVGVIWVLNPWHLRLRPSPRNVGLLAGFGFLLAAALMLNLNFGVSYHGSAVGPNQLLQNIAGTFTTTANEKLNGSREWRLEIWNKIVGYTIFGPYFWTGKGYGINLVEDLGMTPDPNAAVHGKVPPREPENTHIAILARSGVPGFLLWVALQSVWSISVLRVLFFARRTGRRRTTALMSFLIAYWTWFILYMGSAPTLSGPHEGIWFWTIFGVGAAAVRAVRRDGDFFERIGEARRSQRDLETSLSGAAPGSL
jgi:hypothetical protein